MAFPQKPFLFAYIFPESLQSLSKFDSGRLPSAHYHPRTTIWHLRTTILRESLGCSFHLAWGLVHKPRATPLQVSLSSSGDPPCLDAWKGNQYVKKTTMFSEFLDFFCKGFIYNQTQLMKIDHFYEQKNVLAPSEIILFINPNALRM